MHRPIDMALWDGHGLHDPERRPERWYQMVTPLTPQCIDNGTPGIALLGVCSDAGVGRSHGRAGAGKGPNAIRAALANQAWHLPVSCYDAGDLWCVDDDLEQLQREQIAWVERLLDLGHFPLVLGGGHEIALGTHLGLAAHLKRREARGSIGLVSFDAHLDLRKPGRESSATPFQQMAESCREGGRTFRFLGIGVSEVANTASLFESAAAVGASWLSDEQLAPWDLAQAEKRLREFLGSCGTVQLSIDLDVFSAGAAPGVGTPTPRGVSLAVVEHLLQVIRSAPSTVRIADIAGCNPDFDIDGRTARLAARLCHMITRKAALSPAF
jgi:formiminoglutamase